MRAYSLIAVFRDKLLLRLMRAGNLNQGGSPDRLQELTSADVLVARYEWKALSSCRGAD